MKQLPMKHEIMCDKIAKQLQNHKKQAKTQKELTSR